MLKEYELFQGDFLAYSNKKVAPKKVRPLLL